jgi:hypothetical protein
VAARQGGGKGSLIMVALVLTAVGMWIFKPGSEGPDPGVPPIVVKPPTPPQPTTPPVTPTSPPVAGDTGGPKPASIKTINLYINVKPARSDLPLTLMVNDKAVDLDTMTIPVELDKPVTIVASRPGFRVVKRETMYEAKSYAKYKEVGEDIVMDPIRYGLLTLHTSPAALALTNIDGKIWSKQTPFDDEKLPVGNYTILLRNDGLGWEKSIQVQIKEGKHVLLDNVKLSQ